MSNHVHDAQALCKQIIQAEVGKCSCDYPFSSHLIRMGMGLVILYRCRTGAYELVTPNEQVILTAGGYRGFDYLDVAIEILRERRNKLLLQVLADV